MQKDLKSIFGSTTGLDDKSMEFLTQALVKNNLPGFDYLEFKQSLTALSHLNMDETTAYKSAFATASTVGLTKEKLLKTAEHYRTVLMQEKQAFDQAFQKQIKDKVESKRADVEKKKQQILEFRAQIAKLEAEIAKNQETIDQADQAIQASMDKITQTQEQFEQTFQAILNQINCDIDDIKQYI
jgi:chromosome segregation ATPase